MSSILKPKGRMFVVREIHKEFPDLWTKDSEAFDGRKGAIWTTAEEGDAFNYYAGSEWSGEKCNPRMQKILDSCGWHYEFFDAGTVFLYPN